MHTVCILLIDISNPSSLISFNIKYLWVTNNVSSYTLQSSPMSYESELPMKSSYILTRKEKKPTLFLESIIICSNIIEIKYHRWIISPVLQGFVPRILLVAHLTRLTRWVSLVEQELLTLPEHPSSPPVFSRVRVTRSLVLYVCFVDRCLSFCTFTFGIVFSVLLRYTDSDCPFGIFKLYLTHFIDPKHNFKVFILNGI